MSSIAYHHTATTGTASANVFKTSAAVSKPGRVVWLDESHIINISGYTV